MLFDIRDIENSDQTVRKISIQSAFAYTKCNDEKQHFESEYEKGRLPKHNISLDIHDLPHESSSLEWWQCHCHLNGDDSNQYSIFASFCRTIDRFHSTDHNKQYLGTLEWGIVDVKNSEYYTSSSLDPQFISFLLSYPQFFNELDENLVAAYREVLQKNKLPLPDRLCVDKCLVDSNRLYLNYDGNIFLKDDNGCYEIVCHDLSKNISLKLKMQLTQPTQKPYQRSLKIESNEESMFSYVIPRLKCNGTIIMNNNSVNVNGQAWYDHGYGDATKHYGNACVFFPNINFANSINENNGSSELYSQVLYQFNIQLENGYNIVATTSINPVNYSTIKISGLVIEPNSESMEYNHIDNIELNILKSWTSVRTTCEYATRWKLTIPRLQCELYIEAVFDNQEFLTVLCSPGFWAGRMNVHGQINEEQVKGCAFVRCYGSNRKALKSLDHFFTRISKITLNTIANVLPRQPTYEQVVDLVANEEKKHLIKGLDIDVFAKTIISPLRDIIDRGGKAWRSYVCLLCIDCVGNNSFKYEHWLSLAEIVHVGSLIIDDIQDESQIRRGKPACHIIHGTAQAITAGTAGYFLPLHTLIKQTPQLTKDIILDVYDAIFLTLRAAHVGQAADIHGLDYMMERVVETGDSTALEKAVLSIHRLKSGVPAGSLARIGALIGGGTKEQADALENYVQSIGTAFQIIDDVLNLRGFQANVKLRGEDIMAGKVTFPIAVAMNIKFLPDTSKRKYIWDTIKRKTKDTYIINDLVQLLENHGCIEESVKYAKAMVDDAWMTLDAVISDSFHKLFLRAFGLYVLQRYY